jgi:hypothetical protein
MTFVAEAEIRSERRSVDFPTTLHLDRISFLLFISDVTPFTRKRARARPSARTLLSGKFE